MCYFFFSRHIQNYNIPLWFLPFIALSCSAFLCQWNPAAAVDNSKALKQVFYFTFFSGFYSRFPYVRLCITSIDSWVFDKILHHLTYFCSFCFVYLQSTPCKHPVIVLQDVAFTDLHALVEFIYHGEVNVHQRSLSSFLKTAEVLRVSGLTRQQAEETQNVNWLNTITIILVYGQPFDLFLTNFFFFRLSS